MKTFNITNYFQIKIWIEIGIKKLILKLWMLICRGYPSKLKLLWCELYGITLSKWDQMTWQNRKKTKHPWLGKINRDFIKKISVDSLYNYLLNYTHLEWKGSDLTWKIMYRKDCQYAYLSNAMNISIKYIDDVWFLRLLNVFKH
jgi:hypothetical protein